MAHDPKDAPASQVGPQGEDPALGSLETRIASARKAEDERLGRDNDPRVDGRNRGLHIASTMVGYPLGGIVVGWALDSVFDTRPWIMIGLMFLAFFGACLQVVRINKAG